MQDLTEEGINMAIIILKTKAPALALSPINFSQQHFDLYSQQLRVYFNQLDTANGQTLEALNTLSTPSAGTTGARPSTGLQVGQFYFDTTINRPIWWNGTNWINAAGTVV
jgi:hypothetical protein